MSDGIKVNVSVANVVATGFENYLKEMFKDVGRKAAGKIRDEMFDFAKQAISNFYSSYSPKYYRRHGNFNSLAFVKYYQNSHGTVYSGGIRLTPESIPDVYRETRILSEDRDSPFEVFQRVIMEGKHGVGGPSTEKPYDKFIEKQKEIEQHIIDYIEF